jgi:hypothetical protein
VIKIDYGNVVAMQFMKKLHAAHADQRCCHPRRLWDKVGDLTERKDLRQNFTEDFYDDARYWLDHSTLTSDDTTTTNLTMGYSGQWVASSFIDVNLALAKAACQRNHHRCADSGTVG